MLQDAHVREDLEKKQATVVTDNKKNMLAEGAGAQLVLVATLPTPWIWLHRRWRLKSLNKRKEDSDEQLTFAWMLIWEQKQCYLIEGNLLIDLQFFKSRWVDSHFLFKPACALFFQGKVTWSSTFSPWAPQFEHLGVKYVMQKPFSCTSYERKLHYHSLSPPTFSNQVQRFYISAHMPTFTHVKAHAVSTSCSYI